MAPVWEEMRRYCGFDDEAARLVGRYDEIVRPHIAALVDAFYAELDLHEEARAVFTGEAQRTRLKKALATWLAELLSGPHDAAYFERRMRIGRRHVEIRLPQRFMFGGMAILRAGITRILHESGRPDVGRAAEAFGRVLDLELAIMLETFGEAQLSIARNAERASAYAEALALEVRLRVAEDLINRVVAEEDVLPRVARELAQATGFEIVAIVRSEPGSDRMHLVAGEGLAEDIEQTGFDARDTLEGQVVASGEAVVIHDVGRDPRPRIPAYRDLAMDTYLGVPLKSGTEAFGVLILATRRRVDLDGTWLGIVQGVANHLGTAWKTRMLLDRLEEARHVETVARFSRVLAHEVRNPLNSMSLQAALMRRRLVQVPTAVRADVEGALFAFEQETKRLNELVEHYLLIGKAGQLRRERVQLAGLVGDVLRMHEPALREAGIALDVLLGEDLALEVDAAKIGQILHNLVRNALDAMAGGGRLVVRARSIDGRVRLSVRDSGPGVSHPESVFEPFFTTKSLGTGLGLPVAREIARAHGGDLELASGSTAGAELVLTLPIAT